MHFERTPLPSPATTTTSLSTLTSPSTSPNASSSSSSSSLSTPQMSIGFSTNAVNSLPMSIPKSLSSSGLNCAFPSWPKGESFEPFASRSDSGSGSSLTINDSISTAASSYISDEDLFLDDFSSGSSHGRPYLKEAPAPPRPHHLLRRTPLPPLCAAESAKSSSSSKKRRRSSRKERRASRPMTPIAETPETTE